MQGSTRKGKCFQIKKSCYLDISTRSIERHFKDIRYKYSKAKKEIILSKKHKEERLNIITDWLLIITHVI